MLPEWETSRCVANTISCQASLAVRRWGYRVKKIAKDQAEIIVAKGNFHGRDFFAIAASDCNNNGVSDGCDLRDGTSADCNHDDVPDECEALPLADYDFDSGVDLIDLAGFQRCFTGLGPAKFVPCCTVFDSEPDGDVDLADFVAFRGVFSGP